MAYSASCVWPGLRLRRILLAATPGDGAHTRRVDREDPVREQVRDVEVAVRARMRYEAPIPPNNP
jgi:hypothetical protein